MSRSTPYDRPASAKRKGYLSNAWGYAKEMLGLGDDAGAAAPCAVALRAAARAAHFVFGRSGAAATCCA